MIVINNIFQIVSMLFIHNSDQQTNLDSQYAINDSEQEAIHKSDQQVILDSYHAIFDNDKYDILDSEHAIYS